MEIIDKDAEIVWKKILKHIIENGKDFTDHDNRVCREVLYVTSTIKNPSSATKPIEILNSLGHWIYPPLEEIEALTLSKKEIPGYYYNYGARAFNFKDVNQIEGYVMPLLKKDPNSRRATVVFYNPEKDSSFINRDIPSMILMNFNIRNNKLNISCVIRSCDIFFGWPGNIYQNFIMQKHVAKLLGLELGEITLFSVSAHIFEEQFDHIKRIVKDIG